MNRVQRAGFGLISLCFAGCRAGTIEPDAGAADAGAVVGSVALFGAYDPTGISVSFVGLADPVVSLSTTTDADGGYLLGGLPQGVYALSFQKTVTLPVDAGWIDADGGPATLAFSAAFDQDLGSFPNPATVFVDGGGDAGAIDGSGYLAFGPIREALTPLSLFSGVQLVNGNAGLSSPFSNVGTNSGIWGGDFEFVSPDGSQVAFEPEADASAPLAIVPLTGGSPVQIATNVFAYQWSQNGSKVAFQTVSGALGVALTDGGGGPTEVVPGGVWWFRLSPDGSQLAFATSDGGALELAPTDGSSGPRQLAAGNSLDAQFSWDSSQLAFLTCSTLSPECNGTLQMTSMDGGAAAPIATEVTQFQLSPDGTQAAVLLNAVQTGSLELVSAAGGSPVAVATNVAQFQLSPDGGALVYLMGGTNGFTLAATALSPVNPVQVALDVGWQYEVSPDGREAAFLVNDASGVGTLEVAPTDGSGSPVFVGNNVSGPFRFSPDSSKLAYLAGQSAGNAGILEVASMAGHPIQITHQTDLGETAQPLFQFSPDSSELAFLAPSNNTSTGGTGTLEVAPAAGGDPLLFADDCSALGWAGNGRLIGDRQSRLPPWAVVQDGIYAFSVPARAP